MKMLFVPGCALSLTRPKLAERVHRVLVENVGPMEVLLTCCRHVPAVAAGTEVINVCPGCDRRYRENYTDSTTVSLWEVLARGSFFPFPDYGGAEMTILDACPTRSEARVHDAVRELLRRMNVRVVEPRLTRTKGACCGDSLWGNAPTPAVALRLGRQGCPWPPRAGGCVLCSVCGLCGPQRCEDRRDPLVVAGNLRDRESDIALAASA